MKIQLLSYPMMAKSDNTIVDLTIIHSQIVNSWTPNVIGANYISFSNSFGRAVVYKNQLIRIHFESLW